jgi:hypothetical protein
LATTFWTKQRKKWVICFGISEEWMMLEF